MKPIKIAATEKLNAALIEAQGRATTRTITVEDIIRICEQATERLDIAKVAMVGVTLTYTGAQKFPNAYRHIPESTHFTAEYKAGGWYVIDIKRSVCPNRVTDTHLKLTDRAREAALDNLCTY